MILGNGNTSRTRAEMAHGLLDKDYVNAKPMRRSEAVGIKSTHEVIYHWRKIENDRNLEVSRETTIVCGDGLGSLVMCEHM